ncbi:MAG: DUF3488 and transglutaminase-like domain-containing protein [Propioniciclava sp.]|uniref:transglutaminase family protein n=1 Tax=Propioniciclava sp. TaxID=2038686 RepID=UPI0039E3A8C1
MRTPNARLTFAVMVAQCAQLLPWREITLDSGTLVVAALAIVLTGLLGWAGRAWRLRPDVLVAAQATGLAVLAVGGLALLHGAPAAIRGLMLLPSGISFIQRSSVPVAPHPGVTLILIVAVGLLAIATDVFAVSGGRPVLAVASPIALHLVAALLPTATLFSDFVPLAAGIGLVLWAGLRPQPRASASGRALVLASATTATVAALGLAWALAPLLPAFEAPQRPDALQMTDPSLDLKHNIVRGSDEVVIRYTTDDGTGTYLKMATLPVLGDRGFSLAEVKVGTGRMPGVPGSPPGRRRTASVTIGSFASEWLPVPPVPTSFDAPGEWGFALETLDVMALAGPERSSASAGLTYQVNSLEVRPDAETIARASADRAPERELTLALPDGLPARVRNLARTITSGAPTAGAKAQAIQDFLRSSQFTYSTAPSVGTGDSMATIDEFLFSSRRGYCEQFAGAMVILAREAGIPARLAVGFLPGERDDQGWAVTTRDLHTWPELWLDGLGWVAFEPTPGRGANGQEALTPTAEPTPSPPTTPPATAAPAPTLAPATPPPAAPAAPAAPGLPRWLPFAAAATVLLVTAAFAPHWWRARRRAIRLAGSGDARADTLAAWDEVQDTVTRARIAWPEGSPRFAAEKLIVVWSGDAEAARALRTLAASAERAMYDQAERYDGPGYWRAEVTAITAAVKAAKGQRRAASRPGF